MNSYALRNEKYIGDALLQKTVTTDFLNKKRVANKGIVPQYYVENSHEAIIPRALFLPGMRLAVELALGQSNSPRVAEIDTRLEAFLDEHQEPVTDYDEGMVRRLIERITVYEDHLDFEFKSGLETEVQM